MNNYLGIDIGGTKMHLLAEQEGRYIEERVPTGIGSTKEELKAHLEAFISRLPFQPSGIGMAIPGLVEHARRVVCSDVLPGLDGVNAEFFGDNGRKVWFINDVRAALVGERAHHPKDCTMGVIMVGTGIAMAFQSDGVLLEGGKGWAGELGSTVVSTRDGLAKLDRLASGASILEQARQDAAALIARLDSNEPGALQIINQAGIHFGVALGNLINLFNPDVLIIGGSTSTYKGYLSSALQTAKEVALAPSWQSCRIAPPRDPQRIVALGAQQFAREMDI